MAAKYRKKELLFEICQQLGECYAELGELQAAELNFSEALGLEPGNPKPYIGLARLAAQKEQWDQAQSYLREALGLRPDSDEIQSCLGSVLLQSGRREAAWEKFQTALKISPHNREALLGLAQAATEPEQLSLSCGCLEDYLATHLVDFPVLLALARLYSKQGKIFEAREAVDKVLLFQPHNEEALTLKELWRDDDLAAANFS